MKTAFGFFLVSLVIFFVGSLYLPAHLAFFSGIDDTPLFRWLSESSDLRITWWIYALILMLSLLSTSTIFCTAEALLKRVSRRNLLIKLSPQIMHIGVLFILLGHLITASIGFKADMLIQKGKEAQVGKDNAISVEEIKVQMDPNGYYTDWEAKLSWLENGRKIHEGTLRPVHPLYFGQFGIYIKSVALEPDPSVQVRVCRDPGVLWALAGGLLLSVGGLGLVLGKSRAAER